MPIVVYYGMLLLVIVVVITAHNLPLETKLRGMQLIASPPPPSVTEDLDIVVFAPLLTGNLNITAGKHSFYCYAQKEIRLAESQEDLESIWLDIPPMSVLNFAELRTCIRFATARSPRLAVKFGLLPEARYASLIQLLDLMKTENVQRYMFEDPLPQEIRAIRTFHFARD